MNVLFRIPVDIYDGLKKTEFSLMKSTEWQGHCEPLVGDVFTETAVFQDTADRDTLDKLGCSAGAVTFRLRAVATEWIANEEWTQVEAIDTPNPTQLLMLLLACGYCDFLGGDVRLEKYRV